MSATQSVQPQLQNVLPELTHRVFFNKLASLGVVPNTEKEAVDLLFMASKLDEVPLAQLLPDGAKQAVLQQNQGRFGKAARYLQGISDQVDQLQAFDLTPTAQLATDVARLLQDNPLIKQAASLHIQAQA